MENIHTAVNHNAAQQLSKEWSHMPHGLKHDKVKIHLTVSPSKQLHIKELLCNFPSGNHTVWFDPIAKRLGPCKTKNSV